MSESRTFNNDQEEFWAGEFGTEYIERNRGSQLLASNLHFFSEAFRQVRNLSSCIEFGANIGMNLRALKLLYPALEVSAIEINAKAANLLKETVEPSNIYNHSILDFEVNRTWDMALIKGVLIHINPETLPLVYEKVVAASHRYILVAEYYNPSPVAIPYRGNSDRLFKRDFAGEIMDQFDNIELVDYGFAYRRDPSFPQDDITWFLLEKFS
jgi:spore coat polysaccharide biosynthesis protein SpsF